MHRLCSLSPLVGLIFAIIPLSVLRGEESLAFSPAQANAAIATFSNYCFDCHSQGTGEGGIAVDFLATDESFERRVETIEKVIRVLKEQEMPPHDAEQPSIEERVQALDWIQNRLHDFDCGEVSRPGRVTIRRLNKVEYNNTVRDLTGLDLGLADDFPSDDVGNGFDNIGDVLSIPPILLEKYLAAAQQIADQLVADPDRLRRVFPQPMEPTPENEEELVQAARENLEYFASRAFRRRIKNEEIDKLFDLMRSTWESGADLPDVVGTAITVILASPHFLFRVEADDPRDFVDGVRPLNDFELASRLSYFLWSSMPDERLFDLARRGNLHTPEQLAHQAERMLADPKAEALVHNFAGQWLQLRDLERLSPDPTLFSEFDDELRLAMRRETELLFWNVISEDRSILDLLDADYSFLNARLAQHYGIAGVEGDEFRKVHLQGKRRGVLMHASVLLLTSNPTRTSPVKRGKWVLDNLLGEPPPPPPPNVPELAETGETLGTLRQQMEQHRSNPSCAVCHTKMDSLGFGLENFDAIGQWRDTDGRERIDPSGELPGGRQFEGPVDLVQILAEDKRMEYSRCFAQKLLTYALGRGLDVHDRCTVTIMVNKLSAADFKLSALVKSVVTSPAFMYQASAD